MPKLTPKQTMIRTKVVKPSSFSYDLEAYLSSPSCQKFPQFVALEEKINKCKDAINKYKDAINNKASSSSKIITIKKIVPIDSHREVHVTRYINPETYEAFNFIDHLSSPTIEEKPISFLDEELDSLHMLEEELTKIYDMNVIATIMKDLKLVKSRQESSLEAITRFYKNKKIRQKIEKHPLFDGFSRWLSLFHLVRKLEFLFNFMDRNDLEIPFAFWVKLRFLKDMCDLEPRLHSIATRFVNWDKDGIDIAQVAGFAANPFLQYLNANDNGKFLQEHFGELLVTLESLSEKAPNSSSLLTPDLKKFLNEHSISESLLSGNFFLNLMSKFIFFVDHQKFVTIDHTTNKGMRFFKNTCRTHVMVFESYDEIIKHPSKYELDLKTLTQSENIQERECIDAINFLNQLAHFILDHTFMED